MYEHTDKHARTYIYNYMNIQVSGRESEREEEREEERERERETHPTATIDISLTQTWVKDLKS